MAYRLYAEEELSQGLRRVAREQLEGALRQLDGLDRDSIEAGVHDIRKRCKKVRGLVRLVRPGLGKEYQRANKAAREAARELSSIRDAHALLATFDDLVAAHADQLPRAGLLAVRTGLRERAEKATGRVGGDDERVQRARRLLVGLTDRIDEWDAGWDEAVIEAGLAKTYRRGRNGYTTCRENPSDEHLHEWRKRVKYLWYEVRLLAPAAPSVLGPLAKRLHDLSDSLGDDHDLAVLRDTLRAAPDAFGDEREVVDALLVLEWRRTDLQRRSLLLGGRLYVEKPKAFARRVSQYWTVWRELGEELPAGEIAELAETGDGLEEFTRDALYERAQARGLQGRSSMDRRELLASLRAAGTVR